MSRPEKLSREEIAKREIGKTDSSRSINIFLTLFFIAVICSVPIIAHVVEFRRIASGEESGRTVPQIWDVTKILPRGEEVGAIFGAASPGDAFEAARKLNNRMLAEIKTYEDALSDRDVITQWLIPRMQVPITGWLRGGNEDAYCGRDGWLFYRRDIDSLTARGFLDPAVMKKRSESGSELKAAPQPDPVKAIVQFRDQLKARGIDLVLMPVPVKPSIYPEMFSSRYEGHGSAVVNPSVPEFLEKLRAAGVDVFDPANALLAVKSSGAPAYLKTDTHWTPNGMEAVAKDLATHLRSVVELPPATEGRLETKEVPIQAAGDVALMLRLPEGQKFFPKEDVTLRQVFQDGRLMRPDQSSPVLLLGDSFTNIFSLGPMGWGEGAGFAERLSKQLGFPIDVISRNDAGSYATREMLSKELAKGDDRLASKKVVVWEFAARELVFGDWKLLPMEVGQKKEQAGQTKEAGFYVPTAGEKVAVRGTVKAVSPVPAPGSVPYKDHIFMVRLAELESSTDPSAAGREAVVLTWGMRDNAATPAAGLRPGDKVEFDLVPWSEVSSSYEAINRSELDDEEVLLADPVWGEPTPKRSQQ